MRNQTYACDLCCHTLFRRWKKQNNHDHTFDLQPCTLQITSDYLVLTKITTGLVKGDILFDYTRGCVLPFNSENNCIAVLDKCSILHVHLVTQPLKDFGIQVLFLPPYSPDFMPIEKTFSYVKYYLKEHDELWQATTDPKVSKLHLIVWTTHIVKGGSQVADIHSITIIHSYLPRAHVQRGKVMGSVVIVVVVISTKIARSRVLGVSARADYGLNVGNSKKTRSCVSRVWQKDHESYKIMLFIRHAYQPHLQLLCHTHSNISISMQHAHAQSTPVTPLSCISQN